MSEIYESLIKEGMQLKKQHENKKYLFKIFMRSIVNILGMAIASLVFYTLNIVTNFKNNIYIGCSLLILYLYFLIKTIWLCRNNGEKEKIRKNYILYMVLSGAYYTIIYEISTINEIFTKCIITLVIYFITFIICKYVNKYYFIVMLSYMIVIFIFHQIGVINVLSIFHIEFFIILISLFFKNVKDDIKKTEKYVQTDNEYLFFVAVCVLFLSNCFE